MYIQISGIKEKTFGIELNLYNTNVIYINYIRLYKKFNLFSTIFITNSENSIIE